MSEQRVVVTGIGATTPLGGTARRDLGGHARRAKRRHPAHRPWVEKYELPVRIQAKLAVEPTEVLPRVEARRLDRCQQVALIAAREAWADAGAPELDLERLGAIIGTGIGGAHTLLAQDDLLETEACGKVAVLTVPMLMPNGPAAAVGLWVKARGGVHAPVSACASGAEAMAWAYKMIKDGELDVALAGGAESCIHPLPLAGFSQMRAMSTRNDDPEHASRPFDIDRDGFVLGEGAGVVVLEREDHARARGGEDLRRAGGRRHVQRRLPHHRAGAQRRGLVPGHRQGAAQRGTVRRRHRSRQRARDVDPGGRPRRGEHHPASPG